jgi:hypothetical protein
MGGKQTDRKNKKEATKDDEPAAAGSDGIVAAVKKLAIGSVLAEVMPMVPKLMKGEAVAAAAKEEEKENKEDSNEKKDESEGAWEAEKPKDAAGVFESLIARLPLTSALGLDSSPEEALALFTRLEVDFGPIKRKKGNAAMERIEVNVERNLSQYITILLALMCLNALVFRSWFACLPWMVGYQLLSLNLPLMDFIRHHFPQVPEIDLKFRVAGTMVIHTLVWLFFLYEVLFVTYFLAKLPLIGLFVIHAYAVAPEADVEAARKAVNEKKIAEAAEHKPEPTKGAANAGSFILRIKIIVVDSFLMKMAHRVPELIKELKGATAKKAEVKKE